MTEMTLFQANVALVDALGLDKESISSVSINITAGQWPTVTVTHAITSEQLAGLATALKEKFVLGAKS